MGRRVWEQRQAVDHWPSNQIVTMARPDLSVVVPSHNRPALLREALHSVCSHATPGTEILVVDDGSSESIVTRIAARFPGVRSLRLPRQSGFCVSVNHGIRAARAPIVEVLNDDAEVSPGWAEAALACFRDPSVGAVAPLVLRISDGKVDSAGDCYYVGGVAGKRGHGQSWGRSSLSVHEVFGASASSAFYRREALLQVGAFPELFGAYFEDVDLSFRLHRAGWKILFQPSSLVRHHVSSSYGQPRGRLLEQQAQNEDRVFWRNLPLRTLLATLPKHLVVLLAKSCLRFEEGNLRHFLCGKLRLLGEVAEIRKHRRWLKALGPAASPAAWQIDRHYWGRLGPSL
jgi:GT2 family glycosyltransferase